MTKLDKDQLDKITGGAGINQPPSNSDYDGGGPGGGQSTEPPSGDEPVIGGSGRKGK